MPDPLKGPTLSAILHSENGLEKPEPPYTSGRQATVSDKYTLSNHLWSYLRQYAEKHREKGNGFGFGLFGPDGVARTLSARYFKDGSEILIRQRGKTPRRLTPRECARLMGFGEGAKRAFRIPVSDTQSYKQFGNSVAVPAVKAVATHIRRTFCKQLKRPHKSGWRVPDIVDAATRSRMMAGIRGRNTRPELAVRSILHRRGFRYGLHSSRVPGKPDMLLPAHNAAVFVHGCFWHGHDCRFFRLPETRPEFWKDKIDSNRKRDLVVKNLLSEMGWRQLIIWECAIRGQDKDAIERVAKKAETFLRSRRPSLEIRGT